MNKFTENYNQDSILRVPKKTMRRHRRTTFYFALGL